VEHHLFKGKQMTTFLVVGGAVAVLGALIWAANNGPAIEETVEELVDASPVQFRKVSLTIDPSAFDDEEIDEDAQSYAYLWKESQ
jgi:hypothetical protein